MGLPVGQTRDEAWNTNNHIESAFKVFDVVFLELLQNKRLANSNAHRGRYPKATNYCAVLTKN